MKKGEIKEMLGEYGTEQFTIETRVNGHMIRVQPIHDPFIHSTTVIGWWDLVKSLFRGECRVVVKVCGSEAIQRAIMTLNPRTLQAETEEILKARKLSRDTQCFAADSSLNAAGATETN
jgi:hypothetical protein